MSPPTSAKRLFQPIIGNRCCAASSTSRGRCSPKSGEARITKPSAWAMCAAANALSKSSALRTSTTCRRTSRAGAACSRGLRWFAVPVVSHRTATRERLGTASLSSSSHLPLNAPVWKDRPVMLPPGQAGHKPVLIRIIHTRHHNGDGAGGFPGGLHALWSIDHQDVHLEADELRRQLGEAIEASLGPSYLQVNVLSFNIAKVAEPLLEFFEASEPRFVGLTAVVKETDLRDLRARLRLGGKWRYKHAENERDDAHNGTEPHGG